MTGKIIRARPKYIKFDYFDHLDQRLDLKETELFFNQGRSALKFLLQCYSNYLNKQLTIAMQSFNCRVVADAAFEANCKVYLFDVKLSDFSIDINSITKCKTPIDVLLLTHYQGIPNKQYLEIADLCHKKNILLIDDISQSVESKIKDVMVGSLGDFAIKSFAFDKPFSCLEGGSLKINKAVSSKLKKNILEQYLHLKQESKYKSKRDLKILRFLLKYTDPENYHIGLNNLPALRTYSLFGGFKSLYKLTLLIKINNYIREAYKLIYKNKKIKICRLQKEKINLIFLQKIEDNDKSNIRLLENIAVKVGLIPISNEHSNINWNRFSILDKENVFKRYLQEYNIEASNYNWPVPLHILFKNKNEKLILKETYLNSEYCSKNILNIPIWKNLRFISNKL